MYCNILHGTISWLVRQQPWNYGADSFPAFYGTLGFNTEFTRALHLSISWAIPIQSTPPHPTSTRAIQILYYPPTYISVFLVPSLPLAFPPTTYTRTFVLHSCYMPRPSHSPRLFCSNYTWRRVQIMKLFVMQFSPFSCHLMSLQSKYSPWRHFKRPSVYVPPLMPETKFHTCAEPQAKL
jgi:hypothetical protein